MGLRILFLGLGVCGLFWAPWLYLYLTHEPLDHGSVSQAEAALVFGAIVRNGEISPLHEERLLAAKRLYDEGKVNVVVVSNASRAADFMADYLTNAGLPSEAVEIDGRAEKTSGTCLNEQAKQAGRRVILISQSFHLPRISLHCSRAGVEGQLLAAEKFHSGARVSVPLWTKLRVRGGRFVREAALTWSVLLGAYDYL